MELTSTSNMSTNFLELKDCLPNTFPPMSVIALFHSTLLLTCFGSPLNGFPTF